MLDKNSGELSALPFVSIIIPAFNEEKRIESALKAVLSQTYPRESFEVIIVDDGSTDRTDEIVANYPVKLLKHDKNRGDSASRNTGALNAIGDIIATTDADDMVDIDWLKFLIKTFLEKDADSVVGSSHVIYDENNWQQRIISELSICLRSSNYVKNIYDNKGRLGRNKGLGSNQSFKKSVFYKIGGFDIGLTSGMEQDILWRAEEQGYKIEFAPNAIVYIKLRDNFRKFWRQTFFRSAGGIIIHLKYKSKINVLYLFNFIYCPLMISLLLMNLIIESFLSFYAIALLLILPFFYYLIKAWSVHKIINKIDILPIIFVGYISFIISTIGIQKGFIDYFFVYKERLMNF